MDRRTSERARLTHYRRRDEAAEAKRQEAVAAANPTYTPDQLQELKRWQEHPGQFIHENLWVEHIDGGRSVPFELNPGQRKVDQAIEQMRAEGRPVRLLVLKSRKQGISTFVQAIGYAYSSTRSHVHSLLVLDTKDKAATILDVVKKFHMSDERRAFGMRPLVEASNRKELKFGNPDSRTREENPGLQSTLEITSADSKDPGRSGTYHFVHGSEVAYWADDSVWVGIGNALMYAPDTVAVMESTGRGCSGLFYDMCQEALAGRGDWRIVFLSWLDDPRCMRPVSREERETWQWLSPEEEQYASRHGLTLEQAKFRRVMLSDPATRRAGRTPEDVFDEEYPATPDLAFKSGGKHFFRPDTLDALEDSPTRGIRKPLFQGRIRNKTSLEERTPGRFKSCPIEPVLEREPYGPLLIWEYPRDDCEYVIGGDVAEGLAISDNHCAYVMKRHTRQVVAAWRCHDVPSRVAGQVMCLLGWYYGIALVGIEANTHGVAATQEAQRIMYPHLWHDQDVRKEGATPKDRVGWMTTEGVRTYMLECVEFEIQTATIGIPDQQFYVEARTFENIDGKPQGRPGKRDDSIMALAITLQMHMHSGPPRRIPEADRPQPLVAEKPHLVEPDVPVQGKVPISQFSPRLRRTGSKGLFLED